MRGVFVTVTAIVLALAAAAGAADAPPPEVSVLDAANRFLEKDFAPVKLVPSTTVIDSFEDWDATKACWAFREGFVRAEPVHEHATAGRSALKVTFVKPSHPLCRLGYREGTEGWGNAEYERKAALSARVIFNDEIRMDVFNPGGPVKLAVSTGRDFTIELKPGANAIALEISEMIGSLYRLTGVLQRLALSLPDKSDTEVALYVDNVRWVGPGIGENLAKHARLFDLGSASYCRPGFLNVDSTTAYSKESGYGWETPNKVVFEYTKNIVTQCSTGRMPHDELLRDYVMQINTPLLIDLPDGRYRVHLVEGAILGWYSLHRSMYDLTVAANGRPVLVRRAAASPDQIVQCYYGLDQTDYEPGEDRFAKYLAMECHPLEFDVDVTGGQLKLEFPTDPIKQAQVSFIIIYPIDRAAAIEPEIAALWRDIRHRFNDVSYGFIPRKMAEDMHVPGLHEEYLSPETKRERAAALRPSTEDKRRGYLVFTRDPLDEVYPDTVPAPAECGKPFAALVPQAGIASFAPAIHAMRDLDDVNLSVGDFVGPNGERLGADRVDLRVVNCTYRVSGQQSHGDLRYVVMPWYLVRRDKVKVAAGTSRRWWINVDIPGDAAPGRYAATATISAKESAPLKVRLALQVLPFELDPVPADVEYAMYTGIDSHWYQQPFRPGWRFHVSWRPRSTPESKNALDTQVVEWEKLQRVALKAELDLLRRYGFNTLYQWRPEKDMSPDLTGGLNIIMGEEETKKIYPNSPWSSAPAVKAEHRKRAYLYHLSQFNEAAADELRKQGYAVHLNYILAWEDLQQEAGLNRFEGGFLMWRLGAKGCVHNPWRCSWGNPYHPFDGHSGEWGSYCMPGSGPWPTLNPTVVLEGAREGIEDYRWLATLERLAGEKAGTPAADAAREYLAGLRQRINPDAAHYFQGVGLRGSGWGQTWSLRDTAWRGADFARERRKLAELVARLLGKNVDLGGL